LAEILLDSDVIIAWLRGYEPFADALPDMLARGDVLAWTPVSIAEIYAGVKQGEEQDTDGLFLTLEVYPLTAEIGIIAGKYVHRYGKSHAVEVPDALIAATAKVHGLPLWTLNKKHYPMRDIRFFSPP
jgi:predicted nucleic acid-binding protein